LENTSAISKKADVAFLENETSIYELDEKSFENLNGNTNSLEAKNYTYSPNDKKVFS
jgi:hypothetical protein